MGCCAACGKVQYTPHGRKAENDLLKQFLELCHGVGDGWELIPSCVDAPSNNIGSSTIYRLKKKEEEAAMMLDVYRGVTNVSGYVNDLVHYFATQLGSDRFELLEEIDDRRAIYHWEHEWKSQRLQGSKTSFGFASMSNMRMVGSGTYKSSAKPPPTIGEHSDESLLSTDIVSVEVTRDLDSTASHDTLDSSSKLVKHKSRKNKKTSSDFRPKPANFIRNRDFVFYRSLFKLGPAKMCFIAESCEHKLKRKVDDDTVRGRIYQMGVLIRELDDTEKAKLFNLAALEANAENDQDAFILAKRKVKEPLTQITFVICVDARLTMEEGLRLPNDELSELLGEDRVRSFIDQARDYFELAENKLFVKFRALAAAPIGEMGWMPQEKSKHDLQLGTNVKHSTHGHGVVRKFDMKGRIHVAYDNGDVIEHEPSEKDDLYVAVQIGTRVVHPTRGSGTVKQFDETGRIHVKFDNGEYHRYKQPAWRKKMHEYKLLGTGGALETITISLRENTEESREKQGRVKFAVGVTTREVLEYILDYEEDSKTGNVLKNEIVEVRSMFHRVRYQLRKMPSPLTDRDFVYEEIWREVAPMTYVIVMQSIKHPAMKDVPNVVRAKMYLSGFLIEPLFTEDGEDHIAQITHMLCIDPNGFVPPEAIPGIRTSQLLGVVTDMRAHFWRMTQQKKDVAVVNRTRQSKRVSGLGVGGSSHRKHLATTGV